MLYVNAFDIDALVMIAFKLKKFVDYREGLIEAKFDCVFALECGFSFYCIFDIVQ